MILFTTALGWDCLADNAVDSVSAKTGSESTNLESITALLASAEAKSDASLENRKEPTSDNGKWSGRDIAYVLSSIGGLLGVGLIIFFTRRNLTADQWLKINEAEATYLQNKLDSFYGPFAITSQANHLLAQDLRNRQADKNNHRLLEKLFDSEWRNKLTDGDKTLVKEICSTGCILAKLITKNSGSVDPKIQPYLSRVLAHFKILHLAHENKLGSDKKPFLPYIYPKQLDAVIDLEINRLQNRINLLRQNPTIFHGELRILDLAEKHKLESWPDPPRPDFDSGSGTLTPPS